MPKNHEFLRIYLKKYHEKYRRKYLIINMKYIM